MTVFVDAYMQFDARGVLPAPGAWLDQSPAFTAAVAIADAERGRIDRQRNEPSRGERVMAQAKANTQRWESKARG